MDQVRIVKEMREHDRNTGRTGEFIRPRYLVWENVPGAFSSNGGEDFRCVLEEIARIAEAGAVIPRPAKGKWTKAGIIVGDTWSIAWRTHDAQYWGVPQRRKRISLVADFGSQCVGEILFELTSLSETTDEGKQTRKETARDTTDGTGVNDTVAIEGNGQRESHKGDGWRVTDKMYTFNTTEVHGVAYGLDRASFNQGKNAQYDFTIGDNLSPTVIAKGPGAVCCPVYTLKVRGGVERDSSGRKAGKGALVQTEPSGTLGVSQDQYLFQPVAWDGGQISPTLTANNAGGNQRMPDKGNFNHVLVPHVYDTSHADDVVRDCGECSPTLQGRMGTGGNQVPLTVERVVRWIVRRLSPLELERLQGYPDGWTGIGEWVDSKGKKHKDADSPRYKALGNSIALPFWHWMFVRMAKHLPEGATLGSLFDGIGGFPLCWESIHGKGTARWASEIEEFPIAVTKLRFPDD